MAVPARAADRLTSGLKRFQPIVQAAKARDVNESDTVMIVTDMLSEVFGYDKYSEITSEYCIRGTYCDLAVKLEGKLEALIEVKAIGSDLRENHVKQAVDYAANQGVDWVVLTNSITWRVYKIAFTKPVEQDLVIEFDLLSLSPKKAEDIESLYLLAKEGWSKSVLRDYDNQRQALSRFCIGSLTCPPFLVHR